MLKRTPSIGLLSLLAAVSNAAAVPTHPPPPDFLCPSLSLARQPHSSTRNRRKRAPVPGPSSPPQYPDIPDRYDLGNDGKYHKINFQTYDFDAICAQCLASPTPAPMQTGVDVAHDNIVDAASAALDPSSSSTSVSMNIPSGWKPKPQSPVYRVPIIVLSSLTLAAIIATFIVCSVVWRRRRREQADLEKKGVVVKGRKKKVEVVDSDESDDGEEGEGERRRRGKKVWARASARWKANARWVYRRGHGKRPTTTAVRSAQRSPMLSASTSAVSILTTTDVRSGLSQSINPPVPTSTSATLAHPLAQQPLSHPLSPQSPPPPPPTPPPADSDTDENDNLDTSADPPAYRRRTSLRRTTLTPRNRTRTTGTGNRRLGSSAHRSSVTPHASHTQDGEDDLRMRPPAEEDDYVESDGERDRKDPALFRDDGTGEIGRKREGTGSERRRGDGGGNRVDRGVNALRDIGGAGLGAALCEGEGVRVGPLGEGEDGREDGLGVRSGPRQHRSRLGLREPSHGRGRREPEYDDEVCEDEDEQFDEDESGRRGVAFGNSALSGRGGMAAHLATDDKRVLARMAELASAPPPLSPPPPLSASSPPRMRMALRTLSMDLDVDSTIEPETPPPPLSPSDLLPSSSSSSPPLAREMHVGLGSSLSRSRSRSRSRGNDGLEAPSTPAYPQTHPRRQTSLGLEVSAPEWDPDAELAEALHASTCSPSPSPSTSVSSPPSSSSANGRHAHSHPDMPLPPAPVVISSHPHAPLRLAMGYPMVLDGGTSSVSTLESCVVREPSAPSQSHSRHLRSRSHSPPSRPSSPLPLPSHPPPTIYYSKESEEIAGMEPVLGPSAPPFEFGLHDQLHGQLQSHGGDEGVGKELSGFAPSAPHFDFVEDYDPIVLHDPGVGTGMGASASAPPLEEDE